MPGREGGFAYAEWHNEWQALDVGMCLRAKGFSGVVVRSTKPNLSLGGKGVERRVQVEMRKLGVAVDWTVFVVTGTNVHVRAENVHTDTSLLDSPGSGKRPSVPVRLRKPALRSCGFRTDGSPAVAERPVRSARPDRHLATDPSAEDPACKKSLLRTLTASWSTGFRMSLKPMETAQMDSLTRGQLARAADVGIETIRFYEREGLLAEPPRRRSGYRQYPPEAVARVRFIRRGKELGFTLHEISELLELRVDPDKSCSDVRALAKAKIADVEEKMADLDRIKSALQKLARRCRGKGPTSECPILDAIEGE